MSPTCTSCEAELASRLVCEACGALQSVDGDATPFDCLGVAPSQRIDLAALRKRLLVLSRTMHPDFFGNSDAATRQLAQDNSAELNAAFEVLSDDFRRADWLVRSLGGPGEDEERKMPAPFLMEVMEWNELLEEAAGTEPGSPERVAAAELGETLRGERAGIMAAIEDALTPLPEPGSPPLTEVRKQLNAVRYLDRALDRVTEIALSTAPSR